MLQLGASVTLRDKDGKSIEELDTKNLIFIDHPIKELTFKKDFTATVAPSLLHAQEWKNIPRFSIITGRNGKGKSHLLEYALAFLKKQDHNIFYFYNKQEKRRRKPYLFPSPNVAQKIIYPPLKKKTQKKIISQVREYHQGNEQTTPEDIKLIVKQIHQAGEDVALISDEKILQYYDQIARIDPIKHNYHYYTPQGLEDIFQAYEEKNKGLDEKKKEELGPLPWLALQELFKKNGREDLELVYESSQLTFRKCLQIAFSLILTILFTRVRIILSFIMVS